MILSKFTKQNMEVLKKRQPDLHKTVTLHLPDLTPEQQGKVAGLIIEYVLKSEGNDDIFFDDTASSIEEGGMYLG